MRKTRFMRGKDEYLHTDTFDARLVGIIILLLRFAHRLQRLFISCLLPIARTDDTTIHHRRELRIFHAVRSFTLPDSIVRNQP